MTALALKKWVLDAALADPAYGPRVMLAFDKSSPKEALARLEEVLTDFCREHGLRVVRKNF